MKEGDYKSGSRSINGQPLLRLTSKELFGRGNPPVVIVGPAKSGKTVTVVATLMALRDEITSFLLVTDTYYSNDNAYLQKMVPEICVKEFDFKMICEYWADIQRRGRMVAAKTSPAVVKNFCKEYCRNDRELNEKLESTRSIVTQHADMFEDKHALQRAYELFTHNIRVKHIASKFSPMDTRLSNEASLIVKYCRSSTPFPLLIFDDVTSYLNKAPVGVTRIPRVNEKGDISYTDVKGKEAIMHLLRELMYKMRHFGMCAFFVHNIDIFDPSVRRQYGAYMYLGEAAVNAQLSLHNFGQEAKALLKEAWDIAQNYRYHAVVYFPNPGITTHGQKIALYKAEYYDRPMPIGNPTYRAALRKIIYEIKNRRDRLVDPRETKKTNEARIEELARKAEQ